ncbi:MAG: ribose-phosphate diphosphokinase, partial [Actinomycetes bacterium]
MELVPKRKLHMFTGRSHPALAAQIAAELGVELSDARLVDFANGEIRPRFAPSVRGADVFVVQSHGRTPGRSVNDSLLEQWIMIDAAKRASAKRVTAVCPYYGYSRQDRKSKGREPITARLVADFFKTAGAERMITMDLHSGQIQGFFNGPVDH